MTCYFQYFFHWINGSNDNLKNDTFNNKLLIILKTYFHYLPHRFIDQKWNVKTVVHILTKTKNTDRWKQKKKNQFFVSEIPNFYYMGFFRKCSMFLQSIPLKFPSWKSRHLCCKKIFVANLIFFRLQ